MKPSFSPLPLLLAVIVLSGCPDSKLPKVPPKIPEPKAASTKKQHEEPARKPVSFMPEEFKTAITPNFDPEIQR